MEDWAAQTPGYMDYLSAAAGGPPSDQGGSDEGWGWGDKGTPFEGRWVWQADPGGGRPAMWQGNTELAETLAARRQLPGWPGYKGLPREYGTKAQATWRPEATPRDIGWTPDFWTQALSDAGRRVEQGLESGLPPGITLDMTPEQAARTSEARAALGSYIQNAVIPRGVDVPKPIIQREYKSGKEFEEDMERQGYTVGLMRQGGGIAGGQGLAGGQPNMQESVVYTLMTKNEAGEWGNVFDVQLATAPKWQTEGRWPGGAPGYWFSSSEKVWYPVHAGQDTLASIGRTGAATWGLPTTGPTPPISFTESPDYSGRARGPSWSKEAMLEGYRKALQGYNPRSWMVSTPAEKARVREMVERLGWSFSDWLDEMVQGWPTARTPNVRWLS